MKKNAWKHWLGLAVLAVAVFITTAGCPIPTRVTPPPHILVQPIDGDLWVDVYFDNRPLKDLFHDLDNYVPRITETQYQTIYAYREDHYRWVPCNDGYYYDELVVVQQTSTPAPPLQVFLAVEFGPNAQIPMLFTPSQAFVRGQSMRVNLSSLTPDWATELAFTVALIQPWNSHPEYTPNWWSPNVGKFCWGKLGHFVIGVGNTTLGEGDITDGLIHINLPFGVQTQQKPIITQQPGNQIANVGQNVTFTSAATGTPTPTGQWFRNGIAIPGATGTSLTLNNVQLG
ncbi:MAG: immunoglobulin domain-containing protein, partial [Candidatus Buchananbacteria bacterium]